MARYLPVKELSIGDETAYGKIVDISNVRDYFEIFIQFEDEETYHKYDYSDVIKIS